MFDSLLTQLMKNKNPALRQEPRYEPAGVVTLQQEPSLIDWLKSNNRLIPRETQEVIDDLEEDAEISELMDAENQEVIDEEDDSDLNE